jgi:hypothetical protein
VGQYSLEFARQRAAAGEDVVLAGLSSTANGITREDVGAGRLTVLRFKARAYDRSNLRQRAWWTLRVNLGLLSRVRKHLLAADEILFTGSPPFLLHFLAPLNRLLRKRLVYRITDFHPECLMAGMERVPLPLKAFHRLTLAWRRTVGEFEVLGEDQRRRLLEIGVRHDRIRLKRDPSPVSIPPETAPLPRPAELSSHVLLLYSGNFGVAHDHETFLEGYRLHHREGTGRVALWLNAVGAKADLVERLLHEQGLPVHRSRPVPLESLARLLVTPDAHLITLRDLFVGYILYIGSLDSDVHLLCREGLPPTAYHQVPTGQPGQVAAALEALADRAWGIAGDSPRSRRKQPAAPTVA